MKSGLTFGAIVVCWCALLTNSAHADPDQTVRTADQILHEIMAIPARQIPQALLSEAQGVVIIPDVIKVGFVAAIRRGHGVVLVRGPDGAWTLPQFVTLTGGSVGWQAGVQGTDVVLVFMTKKSIDGLLNGKFTIGADASAAAGPVGRNASAATDARLKAEILSYSRSRGLFAGLSLDGSVIETNSAAQVSYYGSMPGQPPQRVPDSAMQLMQELTRLTQFGNAAAEAQAMQQQTPTLAVPNLAGPTPADVRHSLSTNALQLYAILDDPWKKYLALPAEVFEGNRPPSVESLQASLAQYDRVVQGGKYPTLTERAEFRSTYDLLREYVRELSHSANPQLALPPPPTRR